MRSVGPSGAPVGRSAGSSSSGAALDVLAEIAEEGGQARSSQACSIASLSRWFSAWSVAEGLGIRGARVEAGDLVVGVDREHEAGRVRPGLDLQLHVRVAVLPSRRA